MLHSRSKESTTASEYQKVALRRLGRSEIDFSSTASTTKKIARIGNNFKFCQYLVRETGIEPARPKAYAPKAYVYTNFTTRARNVYPVIITNSKYLHKKLNLLHYKHERYRNN